MYRIKRLLATIRRWMRIPSQDLSGRERTLRWWVDFARYCAGELRRDRAQTMAAALSYHTLFSLMPTLVLSLVVMHSFVGPDEMVGYREGIVDFILQPLQQEELIRGIPTPDRQLTEEGIRRQAEFEQVRETLGDQVGFVLSSLESVDFRSIGIVGILLFIYAATGLLATIEGSFNHIYKAGPGRPPYLQIPIYYSVITLGPLVIFATQILQRRIFEQIESLSLGSTILGILAVVTPILGVFAVLFFLFVILPNTNVRWRAAATGAGVAAILWWIGAQLFTLYVSRAAISTLYGALGLAPLFVLWLFLTWLIVLFGLEVAYALQSMTEGRFAWRSFYEGDLIVIDRSLVLPCATRIAQAFNGGHIATMNDLSRTLRVPPAAVLGLVKALQGYAIVHEVHKGRHYGYALQRPADQISAAEVLRSSEKLIPREGAEGSERPWKIVNGLYDELQAQVGDQTLQDLVQDA